jgi:hypothetical protein
MTQMPIAAAGQKPQNAGPYMITLCRLATPVVIRPPTSPQLKPFTFFMSRARQADGGERIHLHMGYFGTSEEAEKWTQLMRGPYPNAFATRAPAGLLRQPNSGVPTLPPVAANGLTDTEVLRVLEIRGSGPAEGEEGKDISLLRPDDTQHRAVLKQAVIQGAPVAFAVQLHWSVQPISLSDVPALSIFRAYKLYAMEGSREGRVWHSLRLGFFDDAISAKQVAHYVRSNFASVAVVPVTEQERKHASEKPVDFSALADPARLDIDKALEATQQPAKPAPAPKAAAPSSTGVGARAQPAAKAPAQPAAKSRRGAEETMEQTLELLKSSDLWSGDDDKSLTETGVRHLHVTRS